MAIFPQIIDQLQLKTIFVISNSLIEHEETTSHNVFFDYLPLLISNLLVVGFFLFFQRNSDIVKSEYKSHIAELEARSLRAQMNPHFIYNAINSVQSLMMLKGEKESNRYIGMLSKLLRFTLEMGDKEGITLEDEVEYLITYVELQQIRLDKDIQYKFHYSLKNPKEIYIINPMLLQPIVENSIIHGITPLRGSGKIEIFFTEKSGFLEVIIEDNGIGRKASQKRNANKKTHKSYATQILRERIDIYNYLKKQKMSFHMEDLNRKGVEAGTRSVIQIPFRSQRKIILNPKKLLS